MTTSTIFVPAGDKPARRSGQIRLHGPEDFEGMRKAGRLTAEALDLIGPLVKPGVATNALDKFVFEFARDHGAYPAPLNYRGYRKSICTSINHGRLRNDARGILPHFIISHRPNHLITRPLHARRKISPDGPEDKEHDNDNEIDHSNSIQKNRRPRTGTLLPILGRQINFSSEYSEECLQYISPTTRQERKQCERAG